MKILSVFGTRPEAIKMAILVKKLNEEIQIQHRVCITSQHKEMLQQVLALFHIQADYDLNLMKPGQTLSLLTSEIITHMQVVFDDFKPNIILVHGDTTTTFATTLVAFYNKIKIAHVEAGLRTYNLQSPFPEEANRLLTSKLANYHFAPTRQNYENLLQEGIIDSSIIQTGNTVIDSLQYIAKITLDITPELATTSVKDLILNQQKYILITGHRRENFGKGLRNICQALLQIAQKYPEIQLIYPVHLNPNVREVVFQQLKEQKNIHLISPVSYQSFVFLMKNTYLILTDSGGIQEEAPSLGKPVLVMRDTTERPEAVEAGTVKLVGTDREKILQETSKLIEEKTYYKTMSQAINPYGDGKASERIINYLKKIKL